MDRARLKQVIIIILALLNAFLLISLLMRKNAEETTHRRVEEQLILLFAADGMAMEEGVLPREEAPSAMNLHRDPAREQAAAVFFLGETASRQEQGDIVVYIGANGSAQFRADGSFTITGVLAEENAEARCQSFCKKFSFSEPVFLLDEAGNGSASAEGLYSKRRVVNSGVGFRFEENVLTSVSGTLLPETGAAVPSETKLLSAAAALTEFQKGRRETGAVVSAVTEVSLCWRLQSTASATVSLQPVWCIVTDTSKYYVNCSTGAVTAE